MDIRVLGTLEILDAGVVIPVQGRKQRAVLAVLVAAGGARMSTDQLIDAVYGEVAPDRARRSIHTFMSSLRSILGEHIRSDRRGYVLDLPDDSVDSRRFERAYALGRELVDDDPETAAEILRKSLSEWRGHAYADIDALGVVDPEIQRLEELRIAAVEARIDADLARGLDRELVSELSGLVAEYPLREGFRAQHMLSLYRSGRQAEALRSFSSARTMFVDQLGLEPSEQLATLELQILDHDPELTIDLRPSIEEMAVLAVDVVVSARTLTERDEEVGRIHALLERVATRAGGWLLDPRGTTMYGVFPTVERALSAAEPLIAGGGRMAVDHGEVDVAGDHVSGPPITRAARLAAVAHPGQVLLSSDAHKALSAGADDGRIVKNLGRQTLVGIPEPAPVFQLIPASGPSEFGPLELDRRPTGEHGSATESVSGYELRQLLWSDDLGSLHLGYQPSLGRSVWVRAFPSAVVGNATFIRRFEAEMHRIAATNHPVLLPVLDFWREPDSATVVYSPVDRGVTFDPTDPVHGGLDTVLAVADAIEFAHEAGVVHGRLHSGSIFIDAGQHPNLAFLGLAPILSGLTPLDAHAGTAPEAIGGEPTPRADVYALAVLTAEASSGERWHPDTGPPQLEGPIGDVIRACIDPTGTGHHFSAGEFSAAIREAAGRPATIRRSIRNPYKGLAPFGEADTGDFFGRNELVDRLIREVGQHRLTAVVGPSGVGKSSAVHAGVLPQLRANRSSPHGSVVVTSMTPGVDPIESLADALGKVATTVPGPLVRSLDSNSVRLGEVVAAVLPPDSELLLVIDQFEELFTLATPADLRTFLAILGRELAAPAGPIRVLLTLRADFLEQPLAHPDFGKLVADRCVIVHGPSRDELAEIILGPAADVGVEIEPGLVTALCDDASTQPGALPLVEHALAELFDSRTSDVITLDAYVAFGGLAGAVGRSAEEVFQGLDDSDQAIARALLVSLVAVTEDSADTRRRLRLPQMVRRGIDKARLDRVLEAFVDRRLIVLDRDPKTHQPTAEVAHEALISEWNRLQTWIDEGREELLVARRLELAAADWIASSRDSSFLLTGGRLDRAETSAGQAAYGIGDNERELLRESRHATDVESARRRRNRRRSMVSLSSALIVTLALAFAANWARGTAERRAIENRVRELTASARGTIGADDDLAILLALEAYELASTLGRPVGGDVVLTVHEATQASRIIARLPVGGSVVLFDAHGDRLITDVGDGSSELVFYDARTFEEVRRLDVTDPPNGATLSHDGTHLAVSYGDVESCGSAYVRIFDLEVGATVQEIAVSSCFGFPQFSPDDRYLTAVGKRSAAVWDRSEPERMPVYLQGATGFAGGPSAFSADGTTIIRASGDVAEPKSVTTYELATGSVVETRPFPVHSIRGVTSVPNTNKLLVATPTSGQLWAPGDVVAERKIALTGLDHGTFSASGSLVALNGNNSSVVVASADGATELDLRGHDGGVLRVAFSNDETILAALVSSGEVVIWDLTPSGPPALANIQAVGLDTLIPLMSSDGRYVATIEASGGTAVARKYATATGALIAQSSPSAGEVAVSRSGEWAGGVNSDGAAWIERLGTNELIFQEDCLDPAAINDEGTHAVFYSACGGNITSLIDLRSGATISSWSRFGDPEFGPPGSPADGLVVDMNMTGPVFRSVSTGLIVASAPIGDEKWRPRFSADGRYLSLGSISDGGYVLSVEAILAGAPKDEFVLINPLVEGGPTRTAMASGAFGVTTHNEDSIRVWWLGTGDQWMNIPTQATAFAFVAMSPDGTVLYYPDRDGVLVRALLDPEELANLARERTTRGFTVEECQRFDIVDDCTSYSDEEGDLR